MHIILSEDYGEIIVDFTNPFITEEENQQYCYTRVNNRFGIAYLPQSDLQNMMGNLYVYHTLPKVFGLMAEDCSQPLTAGRRITGSSPAVPSARRDLPPCCF